jgi:hypothetical protein
VLCKLIPLLFSILIGQDHDGIQVEIMFHDVILERLISSSSQTQRLISCSSLMMSSRNILESSRGSNPIDPHALSLALTQHSEGKNPCKKRRGDKKLLFCDSCDEEDWAKSQAATLVKMELEEPFTTEEGETQTETREQLPLPDAPHFDFSKMLALRPKEPRCEKCIVAGKVRPFCVPCRGSRICCHNRERRRCKQCPNASGICPHGRDRHRCKCCGGKR